MVGRILAPSLWGTWLVVAATAFGAATREATSLPAGAMRPDAIYHNYCSVCHGDRGDGRSRAQKSLVPPPRDFTDGAAKSFTRAYMIAAVRDGKPGTAMVGWKTQLNNADIEAVVDYIRKTFMQAEMPPHLARGRAIYAQTCAVCHGDRGQGAVWSAMPRRPPRAFATPQAKAELSREDMIEAVTHGSHGSAMVSFASQLGKSDIEAVVDFIRAAFIDPVPVAISGASAHGEGHVHAHSPASRSASDMGPPLPNGLSGNAERGARLYRTNCVACHGEKGDGQGKRAYFIKPKPRNFLDAGSRARLNRPALYKAIAMGKSGTDMPAWSKVLTEQQVADVAEFVFRSFVRPGAEPKATARAK